MMRYFKMMQDVYVSERWYLSAPIDGQGRSLDWIFSSGEFARVDGPIRVHFNRFAKRGKSVDYTDLSLETVPIVHPRVASVLVELAPSDVQVIPVEIEGVSDPFCLVNVTRVVKCIDDQRSEEVQYYTADCEEEFRERVGQYRTVIGMRIDPARVGDARIFRPWGYLGRIIVWEGIKQALEKLGTVGVKFEDVS